MIFVTVGTQLPFDRLVRAVDDWAGARGRGGDVFAQTATTGAAGFRPRNLAWAAYLDPPDFERRFAAAHLVVAHAGMGSIIGALAAGKPILVLPRRAALGEQRNDHQLATARRFADRPGVTACLEEGEVAPALDRLASAAPEPATRAIGTEASPELIAALRTFIRG